MKKRWIYNTAAGVLLAVMLTGCGDGTDMEALSNSADNLDTMAVSVQSEAPEGTEPEVTEPPASDEIRLQYRTGFLTAEEEGAVLEAMKTLYQNLELPEYVGEAIHAVSSEEWFEILAKGLYEGARTYILEKGEAVLLSVQVGHDIEEKPYVNIYFQR